MMESNSLHYQLYMKKQIARKSSAPSSGIMSRNHKTNTNLNNQQIYTQDPMHNMQNNMAIKEENSLTRYETNIFVNVRRRRTQHVNIPRNFESFITLANLAILKRNDKFEKSLNIDLGIKFRFQGILAYLRRRYKSSNQN